jgi:predicted nucleic acid-binding protein
VTVAVLDTTFLVELEARAPNALLLADELRAGGEPMRVPAAVWSEFLSPMDALERARAARLLEGATQFEEYGRPHADEAARLQRELVELGKPLAWHDLQVAATASLHDEVLVSNDEAFARVPRLRVLGH